jgi:hypothetical protein
VLLWSVTLRSMARWNTGTKNGMWKGGRSIASNGYVLVRVGTDHHLSDVRGYAYEHRLVAEKKLGRKLRKGEQIHHLNGNKQDNAPSNIEVMVSAAHHRVKHRRRNSNRRLPEQSNPLILCGCGCGTQLALFDGSGRPRQFVSGHNPPKRDRQASFLLAVGNGASIREIAAITGQSLQATKCMASKLVTEGKLKRKTRGVYGRKD